MKKSNPGGIKFVERKYCAICGSTDLKKQYYDILDTESNHGLFSILVCTKCSTGHTNPFPTPSSATKLYADRSSSDFDPKGNPVFEKIKNYVFRRKIKSLTKDLREKPTILDFSTGNGRYANLFETSIRNATVIAVDLHVKKPQSLLPSIRYYPLSDPSWKNKTYDFIMLNHVLEHTYKPKILLKQLYDLLANKGTLYVEVPNLKSPLCHLLSKTYRMFHVPRHVFHFTEKSFEFLLTGSKINKQYVKTELPIMGNQLTIFFSKPINNIYCRFAGIFLYPVQLLIGLISGQKSCIACLFSKKEN